MNRQRIQCFQQLKKNVEAVYYHLRICNFISDLPIAECRRHCGEYKFCSYLEGIVMCLLGELRFVRCGRISVIRFFCKSMKVGMS